METYKIKTDRSFLKTYLFDNNKVLVNKCIFEVDSRLSLNPEIKLYGNIVKQRRSIGFFSDSSIGYYYSNKLEKSKPLTTYMKILLEKINEFFSTEFNGILVNKYLNGLDYISAHSDDEDNLENIGVVALSVGAERIFRIRDIKNKKIIIDLKTENYGIIHMGGDFQKEFIHEIPIEKKVKEIRYSFTFRKHKK